MIVFYVDENYSLIFWASTRSKSSCFFANMKNGVKHHTLNTSSFQLALFLFFTWIYLCSPLNCLRDYKALVMKSVKVSWRDCCLTKLEGGLGIRDLRDWNEATFIHHI